MPARAATATVARAEAAVVMVAAALQEVQIAQDCLTRVLNLQGIQLVLLTCLTKKTKADKHAPLECDRFEKLARLCFVAQRTVRHSTLLLVRALQ